MKGLTISTGSVDLPTASLQQPHYPTAASCFAACPIYLFIRPSSTHDSLLISPIKINPRLKIPTLARQRGCNRGGDGPSQSPSLLLPRSRWQICVLLRKCSHFNFWGGKMTNTTCVCKTEILITHCHTSLPTDAWLGSHVCLNVCCFGKGLRGLVDTGASSWSHTNVVIQHSPILSVAWVGKMTKRRQAKHVIRWRSWEQTFDKGQVMFEEFEREHEWH